MFTLHTNSFLLIGFLIFLFHGVSVLAQNDITNIGAILDLSTRIGKEEKVAMEIATEAFPKLILHVNDSGGDPLLASASATDLINEKKVQAIIGMETWKEASLVTAIGNRAKIPVISFSEPSILPPLTSQRWPFLVRLATNDTLEMQCVASFVGSFEWRRVIAIYEDDIYNTDTGILSILSDALGAVGTEIEHWLAFPPLSTLSNPMDFIEEELEKIVINKQSRVFIIVRSSLELATSVLIQAQHVGLMGKDSVWITTDTVTSQLDMVNSSVISSMQGLIGIKTHFPDKSPSLSSFSTKFDKKFQLLYPKEEMTKPGIYALRAYDTISTVASALVNSAAKRTLVQKILSTNINGLSGIIRFENGGLSRPTIYEVVNVVGKSYKVLNFWSSENGFYEPGKKNGASGTIRVVYWPGGLERIPLGWVMPSETQPLIIGIPGRTSFEKFVKVKEGEEPIGFSIDVFNNAVKLLKYPLPHEFRSFSGSSLGLYDDLVDQVYYKNVGAVVGDITILANRSDYVEFTQPYAESGLTMVIPVKPESRDWLFAKPFTPTMWLVVSIVFVYTMFVVWFLEHRTNPAFKGPWKTQLSTAMWFTFSTLFFAHKENLRSNFTKVVMVVWLFVVFVVTSSYTASLTSMLTVQRLEPTVTDIETLKRSNSPVGCDGDSFIRNYIENVLGFHPNNIVNVKSEYDYEDEFKSGRIKAAFLELPYEKVFISRYCKNFQAAGLTYRFGGLAFVFPKGSPLTRDFSKAFLNLSEDGTLDKLEKYWFHPSPQCSNMDNATDNQSLSLSNFWTLFLVTLFTSTCTLVLYIVHLYTKLRRHSAPTLGNPSCTANSFWSGIKRLGAYLANGQLQHSHSDPLSAQAGGVNLMISSNGEFLSEYNTPGHLESNAASEIEMPESYIGGSDTHTRALNLANSFPTLNRHLNRSSNENSKWQHIPRST
ncbi:hypothetical protein ACHQM5_003087 [Ranunculus cassubicifolius]